MEELDLMYQQRKEKAQSDYNNRLNDFKDRMKNGKASSSQGGSRAGKA